MATFPGDYNEKAKLVIDPTKVGGTLTDFPVLIDETCLPLRIFDADGDTPAQNGGGDIRFSTDEAGSTQIPCEIVGFVTDNTPSNGTCEIWIEVPSVSSSADTDIWIWWSSGGGDTQPAEDATYGKEDVWNSNFILVQHLEQDPSGGAPQMTDSTANDHDGTSSGTMTSGDSVAGKIGKGLDFDGSDDVVSFGDIAAIDGASDLTAEAWVKVTTVAGEQVLFGKTDETTDTNFDVTMRDSGKLRVHMTDGAAQDYATTDSVEIAIDTWYHIAFQYDGGGAGDQDKVKLRVNGADKAMTTDAGAFEATLNANTDNVTIGDSHSGGGGNATTGIIDEFRISSNTRNNDWLNATYENGNDPDAFIETDGTPTGAAAVGVTATTDITVTWKDNFDGTETSVRIERSDDGSTGWTELSSEAAGTVTYTDTVGAASTQKYYRVRVETSASVFSDYSSVVNATTAPAAPSGLAIANADDSTVLTATWTDNSSDETSFSLERSNDGASGWAEVATPAANATSATDDVAARDTTRYYRIRAVRSGDSLNSAYSSTANNVTAPTDPSSLAVTADQGDQQLRVAWTDNSSTETTFSIERRKAGEAAFAQVTTDTTSPYDNTSLDDETLYAYRVRAYNATNTVYSGYTSIVAARTTSPKPTNLRALPTLESGSGATVSIMLLWDQSSTRDTGVKVERSDDDAVWSTLATTSKGALQYEDTGRTRGSTYYYRVSTVGPDGTSAVTSSVSVVADVTTNAGLEFAINKKLNSFPTE